MISPIRYGYIRDANGQLTDYKSGDRFVYVEPYDTPFPRQQQVGIFKCILIHHGKDTECKACGLMGHKIGTDTCKAKPTEKILAFKGYHHPLSNHFPCELKVYGKSFPSLEHAFFCFMAVELGQEELAERIRRAKHAGESKRLSKDIADDTERWNWEERNIEVMQYLLEVKDQQCLHFRQCLDENRDYILAEATPSKLWATGMSPFVTEHTAPKFWPGKNLLGSMLTTMAQHLTSPSGTDSPIMSQSQGDSLDTPLVQRSETSSETAEPCGSMENLSVPDENLSENSLCNMDVNTTDSHNLVSPNLNRPSVNPVKPSVKAT